jgi:putative tricarboxylic transport membrane protein
MRKELQFVAAGMVACLLTTASGTAAAAAAWKPEKNVEIVINTAPGSGQDATGRTIQGILQERRLVEVPIAIVNKPGGGGVIAYTYLNQRRGDGNLVAIASKSLLTNHIMGRAPLTYTDLTPVAILFEEYISVAVKADSPIKTGKDMLDRMKKDPASLSFGVATSLGNPNHQGVASALKAVGVDLKKTKNVVFQSGGNAITALLGGHVDVVPGSVGLMKSHLEAGTIRLIAIASPKRLTGIFATTPTWKEQGADVTVSNWRGLVGPSGMTAEQLAFWDAAMRGLSQSDGWKKELDANYWANDYTASREARAYLDADYAALKAFLTEIDLAARK